MAAALMAALACAPTLPEPGPDVAVQRWMQAAVSLDGEAVSRLSCRTWQSDPQQNSRFFSALGVPVQNFGPGGGGGGGLGIIGGGGTGLANYDVSELKYATTATEGIDAKVRVTGLLRMATGMVSQSLSINSQVGVKREDTAWRLCGPSSSSS